MEQLTQILNTLAAKLGVAVDVLWAALMKQAIYAGIGDIIWIGALSYATTWVVKYVRLVHEKTQHDSFDGGWEEIAWLPCGITMIATIVLWIVTIAGLPMTFAEFFNPQYWALKQILGH